MLKDAWAENIQKADIPLCVWPDVEDYDAVEFFIGWRYPEGIFSKVCIMIRARFGANNDSSGCWAAFE